MIGTTWRAWPVDTSSVRGMSGGRLYIYWDRGRVDDRYNVAGMASGHIECAGYERESFIYIYIYWDRGRVDDRYNVAGVASGHIECAGYERESFIYILGQRKGG